MQGIENVNRIHLKFGSPLQREMLWTGRHPEMPGDWVAFEVNGQDVLFQRIEEKRVGGIKAWLSAIRAISLTATLMPSLAVVLWIYLSGLEVEWMTVIPAILGVLCLQIAVNLFNDVGDYIKLIDLPTSLGGSGVIQKAWLTTKQVRNGAWTALIAGGLLGVPALIQSPQGIFLCGVLAVFGVLGYSGRPFHLKYKALGDLAVFALCGPVLAMGVSYAAIGEVSHGVMAIGVFFGFASAAILNANNMNDIEVDTARGASTLASVLGFRVARRLQMIYYIGVFGSLIWLVDWQWYWFYIVFLSLPLVLKQIKTLNSTEYSSSPTLVDIRFDAAKTHLLLGVLLSLSIVLEIAFR